jgi:hypothetical protein
MFEGIFQKRNQQNGNDFLIRYITEILKESSAGLQILSFQLYIFFQMIDLFLQIHHFGI